MPKDGTKIMPRRRRKDTKKIQEQKKKKKCKLNKTLPKKNLKNKMHTKNN